MASPSTRTGNSADRPTGIFISYRRSDTDHVAGRLADHLTLALNVPQVFIDVDSIPLGVDFVEAILQALRRTAVLLVLIGTHWLTASDHQGRRRLDDAHDPIVIEIEEALRLEVHVLPVLVDDAQMPKQDELPPSIQTLVRRNAARLRASTFRRDAETLLEHIARLSVTPVAPRHADAPRSRTAGGRSPITRRSVLRGSAVVSLAGLAGAGWWGASQLAGARPLWTFATGGEVYSSPTVSDEVVYVGSNDHYLYALGARTGSMRWRYPAGAAVTSSPTVSEDVVYVGSNDRRLHAVAAADGKRVWAFRTGAEIHSSPVVGDGSVFVGSRDNFLYALSAQDGRLLWRFAGQPHDDLVQGFNSSPTVDDGVVYVGCRDRNVYAVDAVAGFQRWRRTTGSSVDSSPRVVGDAVLIGSDDSRLWSLQKSDGEPTWVFPAGGGVVSTPAVVDSVCYFGADDGLLYAVDLSTGRKRWTFGTGASIRSSPRVWGDVVCFGSRDYRLYGVDRSTGEEIWRYSTGGPIDDSSPAQSASTIYVGSLDGHVHAFRGLQA